MLEDSPEVSVGIVKGSQAEKFLEQCDADEFHGIRGLILQISLAPEVDGDRIIALDRPPIVFRVYQDESYRITFYMENQSLMKVWDVRRVQD